MKWVKVSKNVWRNNRGNEIVKYRMAGRWYYLCYTYGNSEYGDYTRKSDLSTAKAFFGDERFKK